MANVHAAHIAVRLIGPVIIVSIGAADEAPSAVVTMVVVVMMTMVPVGCEAGIAAANVAGSARGAEIPAALNMSTALIAAAASNTAAAKSTSARGGADMTSASASASSMAATRTGAAKFLCECRASEHGAGEKRRGDRPDELGPIEHDLLRYACSLAAGTQPKSNGIRRNA